MKLSSRPQSSKKKTPYPPNPTNPIKPTPTHHPTLPNEPYKPPFQQKKPTETLIESPFSLKYVRQAARYRIL